MRWNWTENRCPKSFAKFWCVCVIFLFHLVWNPFVQHKVLMTFYASIEWTHLRHPNTSFIHPHIVHTVSIHSRIKCHLNWSKYLSWKLEWEFRLELDEKYFVEDAFTHRFGFVTRNLHFPCPQISRTFILYKLTYLNNCKNKRSTNNQSR